MAFWRLSNGFGSTNPIDQILDSANPSLPDLLKEHNILHDLSSPNTKLIEYLREPEVLKQLVKYIIDVQPAQADTKEESATSGGSKGAESGDSSEPGSTNNNESDEESATKKDSNTLESKDGASPSAGYQPNNEEDEDTVMKDSDDISKDASATHSDGSDNVDSNDESNANAEVDSDEEGASLQPEKSHENDNIESEDQNEIQQREYQDSYRDEYLDEDGDEYNDGQFLSESDTAQHNAHIASEILAADVWSITESFMAQPELLQDLWDVLEFRPPLSMSFTTFFTKINESLLDRITNEMLSFIKTQENFVKSFMKHIDNPPLMDFLLKVISSDKPDHPTGIIDFLQHQRLIPSFISFLGPSIPSSVQSAAGDFLKAFVAISANSNSDNTTIGPNELSRELVSEPCIKELVRLMLYGGTGLATGVGVVIEIIRKNNSDYDDVSVMHTTLESHPPSPRDPIYLGHLVSIFAANVPKFRRMLIKQHTDALKTPFGQIEPLGFERFKICELVAELLHCSNMALLNSNEGAEIVKARDEERTRVKRALAAEAKGESEDSAEIQEYQSYDQEDNEVAEEKELPISIEESEETPSEEKAEDADKKSVSKDITEEDASSKKEPSNEKIEERFQDLNVNEPQQSPTESPDGVFPSIEMFRQDTVVGDKLKLALYDNKVIIYILNMFFRFPWNNFLHNVVFDIVQQVLNGPMTNGFNRYLAIDLFDRGRLTSLICEGQKLCAEYQAVNKTRLGYMGHLTLISEEVVKLNTLFSPGVISPIIQHAIETDEWQLYETETLVRTREKYNAILGGSSPSDEVQSVNSDAIILRNDDKPIGDFTYYDDNDDINDDANGIPEEDNADYRLMGILGAQDLAGSLGAGMDASGFKDDYDDSDESGDIPRRPRRGSRDDGDLGVRDLDDDSSDSDNNNQKASLDDENSSSDYDKYFSRPLVGESGKEEASTADNEKALLSETSHDNGHDEPNVGQDDGLPADDSSDTKQTGAENRVLLFGSASDSEEEDEENDELAEQQRRKQQQRMVFDADEEDDDDGLGLVRSKSHHEMDWSSEDAQKIMDQYETSQQY